MKKLLAATLLAGLASMASTAALAQSGTPRLDQRQTNQAQRIEQGKESGSLTRREARRLEAGQARVGRMERRAKADGEVTKRERARIQHAQNVQSRRIAKQKHDRQSKP